MKNRKQELLEEMKAIVKRHPSFDKESIHYELDEALLRFIKDDAVTILFNSLDLWYA